MRNALASELKKEGHAEAAAEVKALKKPGVAAWAVNQLYWRHREGFEAIVTAGDAYRDAQKEALAGERTDRLMQAEAARRTAVDEGRRRAESLIAESGQSSSAVVASRIATTLEAIASYGSSNPRPYDGCASADREPPGFAALAALAPPARSPKPTPTSPEPQSGTATATLPVPAAPDVGAEATAEAEARAEAEAEARAKEAERARLDASIEATAAELRAAKEAVAQAERTLATARQKASELRERQEVLKGRRRGLN